MPEDEVAMEHGFLVKDVKFVSRNDGNLISVTLHAPFNQEMWAELGGMLDDYFNVVFEPQQGELDLEGGESEEE